MEDSLLIIQFKGCGVNKSMNSNAGLSDLALSNVEALANGEFPEYSILMI